MPGHAVSPRLGNEEGMFLAVLSFAALLPGFDLDCRPSSLVTAGLDRAVHADDQRVMSS
jgi:hypothetical protein